MSTIEKLFVQIFDRKRQIGERLNHQKLLYEQHLASKLLIQGITPPPWLLHSDGFASSSRDLNKEDLIHDLLLPRPKPPASYSNASHLYAKLFPTATRDEMQYDLFNASNALCKGSDDSRPGVLPQCLFKGREGTHDLVAESPLDRAVPGNDASLDQSLARIQRSRSRQKALEIRSSRKLSSKRRLEDNPSTVTAEQEMPILSIAAIDRNVSPVHMSVAKEDTSCKEVEAVTHSIKQLDASTHCRSSPSDCDKLSIVESLVAPDSDPRNEREFSMPVALEPDVKRHSEDNLPTVTAGQDMLIQRIAAVDRNLSPAQMSLAKEDTSCREVEAFSHSIKPMDASTHCRSSPSDCHKLSIVESLVAPDSDPRNEREFSMPVAHEPDVERHSEDNLPTVTAGQDMVKQGSEAAESNLSSTTRSSIAKKQKTSSKEAEAFGLTTKKMDASTTYLSPPGNCQDLSMEKSAVAPDGVPRKERESSKRVAEQDLLIRGSAAVDRNLSSTAHNSLAKKQKTSCEEPEAFRHAIKKMSASTVCPSTPSDCQDLSIKNFAVAPDSVPSKEREIFKRFADEPDAMCRLKDSPSLTAEPDMLMQGSGAVDRNSIPLKLKSVGEGQNTSRKGAEAFRRSTNEIGASTVCQSLPGDCQDSSMEESLVAPNSPPSRKWEISQRVDNAPEFKCLLEDSLPTETAEQDPLMQGIGVVDRNSSPPICKSIAQKPVTSCYGADSYRHTIKEMDASTNSCLRCDDCQNSSMEESRVAPDSASGRKWEISQHFDNAPEFKCLLEDSLTTEIAEQDLLMQGIGVLDRISSPPTRKSIAQKPDTSCYGADAYRHTIMGMDASTICRSLPGDCQNSSMKESRVAPGSAPSREWEISQRLADEPEVKRLLEESLPTETAEQDMLIQGSRAVDRNLSSPAHKFITEMQDTSCNGVDGFRHTIKEMDASTICRSVPGDCQNSSMEESIVAPDGAPSGEREISKSFAYEPEVKCLFEDNLPIETAEQEALIQGSAAADRNMSPTHTTKQMDASTIFRSLPGNCRDLSMEESLVAQDSAPSGEREISKCFAYAPEVRFLFEDNLPIETAKQETLIQGSAAADRNMSPPTHTTKQMDTSTTCLPLASDCQNFSTEESPVAPDCVPSNEREISQRFADEPSAMIYVSCDGKSPKYSPFTEQLSETHGLRRDEGEISGSRPEESNTATEMGGAYTVQNEESSYDPCSLSSAGQTVIVNEPSESCVCDDVKSFETNKNLESSSFQFTRVSSLESTSLKADDFPSDGVNFSGEFNGPCVSPGGKTVDGVAARSGVSSNQGISSPELAFFRIDEGGGEDDNLDASDHICPEETGSLRDSLLCLSRDSKKAVDSALNIAGLGSHSTEISLSCSDRQRSSNTKLDCFPVGRSEQDVNGVDAPKTRQEETLCSISNSMVPTIDPLSNEASVSPSYCQKSSMEESLLAPDCVPSNEVEISEGFADEPDAMVNASFDGKSPQYNPFTEALIENQGLCCEVEEISGSRLEESNASIEVGGTYTVEKEESCYDPFSLSSAGQTAAVNGPLERCVGDESPPLKASLESPPLKADDHPSNGAKFSGEFKRPCVSPGKKTVNGVSASSGGSSNHGIYSPELAHFQIDESGEEDGNADGSDHICSEETGSLRSSLLCASKDKKKSIDSALNTASLGSHYSEIFLSGSDRQRSSNAALGCFPVGGEIEQDVNGVDALKTCQEETDCIRQPLCDISNNMVPTIDSSSKKASDPPSDYENFSTEESLAVPDFVFSSQREVFEGFADEPDTMIDVACDGKSPIYNPIIEELIENHGLRFKEEEISRSFPDESDTSIEMGATYIVQKDESSYDPCSLLSAGQTVAVTGPLESCVGGDFKSFEFNGILGLSSFQVTPDASLGTRPLEADDLSSVGAKFSWELNVPCVSPGRKSIDGLAARSGGSSSRGSSNPEFACFPIDECAEEDDDDADDADHICSEEAGLSRDSLHCLSEDKEKGTDSASNTAGLGSHCTEISLSDSDRQRRSNAELDCFPAGRESEQDVHGVETLKTRQQETGCIRQPLFNISNSMVPAIGSLSSKALESFTRSSGMSELNDKTSQKSRNSSRRSVRLSQQKQSQNFSLGTSGVKKRSESLRTRFSKPKASAKTSMEIRSVGITEKEPMRRNIVSNMSSFLPLVQQKQAAACPPVKKEVKVKALEAAEAAKRLAEKKENERKHKKEALKLKRARMEQENLRRMELVKKAKEAEKKKKDAEMAARKRQREEDERKEKERKKKRFGEARTQQKGNALQMSVDKAEDGKTNRKNEGNAVMGKTIDVEQNDERAGTSLANNLAVSSSDKASDSNTASCSTPKQNQNNSSTSQEIREKSYEISPYCCSDEEDEEEDDLSNKKFIPSWASKSNLRLALSSSNALDPSFVFPLKSFCNLNEVLLPRELQRR